VALMVVGPEHKAVDLGSTVCIIFVGVHVEVYERVFNRGVHAAS